MIPREIIKIIISHLPLEALLQFSRVSKDFNFLCSTSSAWERIAFKYGVYKDPKPMKPFMPRMKCAPTPAQVLKHNEDVDKYAVIIEQYNKKVAEYRATASSTIFSPEDCETFKKRMLSTLYKSTDGVLWCHFCGPILVIMTQDREVISYSRLFPINGENHLICESCFTKRKNDVNIEKECLKLCKSINNHIQQMDSKIIKPFLKKSYFIQFIEKLGKVKSSISEIFNFKAGGHYISSEAKLVCKWEIERWRETYHHLTKLQILLNRPLNNTILQSLEYFESEFNRLCDVVTHDISHPYWHTKFEQDYRC